MFESSLMKSSCDGIPSGFQQFVGQLSFFQLRQLEIASIGRVLKQCPSSHVLLTHFQVYASSSGAQRIARYRVFCELGDRLIHFRGAGSFVAGCNFTTQHGRSFEQQEAGQMEQQVEGSSF